MADIFRPPGAFRHPPTQPFYQSGCQSVALNLLGQDQFFGAAGQPPTQSDWPVPKGYKSTAHHTFCQSSSVTLYLQSEVIVFRAPTAFRPRAALPGRSVLDSEGSVWQNPLLTLLKNRDTFFGEAGQPPANMDWPVPKGYTPASILKTWVDSRNLLVLGNDQFFAAPGMGPTYDWPNPRGAQYPISLRQFEFTLPMETLGVVPVNPFFMLDWPVPKSAVGSISLRTWAETTKLNLIGQDAFPFAQRDWPVPKGAPHPISLRTIAVEYVGTSVAISGLAEEMEFIVFINRSMTGDVEINRSLSAEVRINRTADLTLER